MYRRRQAPGAHVEEQSASSSPRTRSLRPPGWLYKPGALRSLDVCLDLNGPFIDVSFVFFVKEPSAVRSNSVSAPNSTPTSYRRLVVSSCKAEGQPAEGR